MQQEERPEPPRLRWRLFLTCWMLVSLHFATNVVREHYPAFTLIDQGDFRLDEYAGFHADIFEHTDGHHYVGNQVLGSVVAAVPMLVFKPVLDRLEEIGRERAARAPPPREGEYDTEYPNRAKFFATVRERGLDLKFGAATVITSVFLTAPLAAGLALLVMELLRRKGVPWGRAAWLGALSVFATPVFYRAAGLNHNLMVMAAAFGSFAVMWPAVEEGVPLSRSRRFWAGFLAATTLALDYAGVVLLLCLFAYLLWTHGGLRRAADSLRAAPAFVLGGVPPVLFLWWSQWTMYGDPFQPGQHWMPTQNIYVNEGHRGMTLPDGDLFLRNLFDLDWGLFAFGPLMLLALLPAPRDIEAPLLPSRERRFVWAICLAFMVFCSCNQYSRLQWNTGFRYLLPLVPFLFLALSDRLAALRARTLALIAAPAVLHTWVLAMVRYTPPGRGKPQAIPESWTRVLEGGVQLPWLNVVRNTPSIDLPFLRSAWFPYAILAVAVGATWLLWRGTGTPTGPHGKPAR